MKIIEENKAVDLTKTVKVEATDKAKHLVKGKVYEVHPLHAEGLINKGWAKEVKK